MTRCLILLYFTLFTFQSIGQNQCGTDIDIQLKIKEAPSFSNLVELNWRISDMPNTQNKSSKPSRSVIIIPVVFHIIHNNGIGNITEEQIQSAMEMINQDYSRTNSDTASTRTIFKPFAANTEIEFRLAQIDPDGNCTNGIVRIYEPIMSKEAYDNVKYKSYWPSSSYLNIWVVNKIQLPSGGSPAGLATFPGVGSWNLFGLLIQHNMIGSVGTGNGSYALTHEIGHCLNLLHTFSGGCGTNCETSGDRICDTPPVSTYSVTCNYSSNQCSNDTQGPSPFTADMPDQIENFMSYSTCPNMFTLGQKTRMHNTLTNFQTMANLVSTNNLIATGVLNTTLGICKAEFRAINNTICMGQTVQFKEEAFFNPKNYFWEFEGALQPTSTDKNPIITYLKPGNYKVTLTVEDIYGTTSSITKNSYVTVLSSLGNTAPFYESFDQYNSMEEANWGTQIYDSAIGWKVDPLHGYSGNQSLKATSYGKKGFHELISPTYDGSNLETGIFSFRIAYAPVSNESGNLLRVFISGDCGESWQTAKYFAGGTLATTNMLNAPYNNPKTTDWSLETINIPVSHLTPNLRIKFSFSVKNGNNLFIDDLNLSGQVNRDLNLRAPYNGITGVLANPTLNWNAIDTIDHYALEIDTDTNFNSVNYEWHQLNYISTNSNNSDTEWPLTNLVDGETYYWKVIGSLHGVDTAISEVWSFKVDSSALGISDLADQPFKVIAYPNPSTDVVYLNVTRATKEDVQIVMYDVTGNLVKTIFSGELIETETQFTISRGNLTNGIYLIQTLSKNGMDTQKIVLE